MAPDSRGATWDWFATSSFGPDLAFIAAALAQARALYSVDAARLGMQGFSDGATYALSLGAPAPGRPQAGAARAASALRGLARPGVVSVAGLPACRTAPPAGLPRRTRVCARAAGLANGNLFSRVMANSPGGILPIVTQGRPPVFVSAGVQDTLFPISQGGDSVSACSIPTIYMQDSACADGKHSRRRCTSQQVMMRRSVCVSWLGAGCCSADADGAQCARAVVGGCDVPRAAAQVVCQLQGRGYNVTYDRFQGGHVLPPAAAASMVAWLLGRGAPASAASPLCPGST